MKDNFGKLTSLVMFNTNYFYTNFTKRSQIEFGIRKNVAFNAIIYIPKIKKW